MKPAPQAQPDQLERIMNDADSAARALAKNADPTPSLLQHVITADVLPLLKALAAEVGDRDEDLDERVSDIEGTFNDTVAALFTAQREKISDILRRAVLLGEEVCALTLPPSQQTKEKGRLLAALATEALQEIETAPAAGDEDDENAPEPEGETGGDEEAGDATQE